MSAVVTSEAQPSSGYEPDFPERRYRTVFRVNEPVSEVAAAAKQQLRGWLASSRKQVNMLA